MVACTITQQTLCNTYTGLGAWLGLCTANPGATNNPSTNETTGGSYARLQTTWGTVATLTGSATNSGSAMTLSVPAGTFTYMILCSASTTNTTNMVDNATIVNVTMGSSGQIVLTPTITFS